MIDLQHFGSQDVVLSSSSKYFYFVYFSTDIGYMAEKEKLNKIKSVLALKGMTQKELASRLGRSSNTISRICRNDTQPSVILLKQIADLLDVDMGDLLVSTRKK